MGFIKIFSATTMFLMIGSSNFAYASPSFDCSKATQPDEYAICASEKLSQLDRVIAGAYSYLKSSRGSKAASEIAMPLLRMRQACGGDVQCIYDRQVDAIRAYQNHGAPVSLPSWVETSRTNVSASAVTNIYVDNSISVLQANLDDKAISLLILRDMIRQQQALSASGSKISAQAVSELKKRLGSVENEITEISASARTKYSTSIRPNNPDADLSAREKSKHFPPVPYYVAGRQGNGEFWLDPKVKDSGELVYWLNFIDPDERNERVTSSFELSLTELGQIRTALGKVYDWSETAKQNKVRKRYEKRAVCFPVEDCEQQVQGNTSTQVDFLIYEDGATGARIVRNKGAFTEAYNMSVESVAMLSAYLDFVATSAEAEFRAGSMTEETLDQMFE
ncbi:lysozyme inhibitor LprI family protein [Celeribacter halophilus]|uniref:lysozyme inhibitor LprI family protein n=1 Tax=Celeribacter halophilus TaxID=576117 RepID=UPI003A918CCC